MTTPTHLTMASIHEHPPRRAPSSSIRKAISGSEGLPSLFFVLFIIIPTFTRDVCLQVGVDVVFQALYRSWFGYAWLAI